MLEEVALSPALTQFHIAINILKITRFTRVRQDFENSKSCLQNLEYSRSYQQDLVIADTTAGPTLLLVFSVTPFKKIDQNKNQNHSIDKVQNLGNESR